MVATPRPAAPTDATDRSPGGPTATGSPPGTAGRAATASGREWVFVGLAAASLAGLLALQHAVISQPGPLPGGPAVLYLILAWWAVTGLGVAALLRTQRRQVTVGLVLVGTIAVHTLALTSGPRLSDDLYRYVWDARVQTSGIDPYRHRTNSAELAHLRDDWLWPDPAGCAELGRGPGCTRLNYPRAHTIYPPVAQAAFAVVHYLPGPPRENKIQMYAGLASVGLTALLMGVLVASGRDPRLAAAYGWSPLAGVDVGIDGHVDVLAVAFGVAGLALLSQRLAGRGHDDQADLGRLGRLGHRLVSPRRAAAAGALLGAAVAVKLYPAVLLVAAVRRRPVPVLAGAVGVVALSYVPHVVAVGPATTLGFLPEYLSTEGYDDGARFLLLGYAGLHGLTAQVVAGVLLVAAAVAVLRSDPARLSPELGSLWLLGTAFLVATPVQPWYGGCLVALAILANRLEWVAVAVAPYVVYQSLFTDLIINDRTVRAGAYAVGAAVVALVSIARWQSSRRRGRTDGQGSSKGSVIPSTASAQSQPPRAGSSATTRQTSSRSLATLRPNTSRTASWLTAEPARRLRRRSP